MIKTSHCKVHWPAAETRGGNQDVCLTQGGNIKQQLAVSVFGVLVRLVATEGTSADYLWARNLIEYTGYGTDAMLEQISRWAIRRYPAT